MTSYNINMTFLEFIKFNTYNITITYNYQQTFYIKIAK